ncbi:alpha-tectorin-like [Anabas testudineus]|uniref:ZP domain-containing protein n=1 Tax=Anabas testudineus TaxID=64144 RepID=A0A7N6AFI4_ANATE|nr:alpha-tectorin-like [Anabas testudineus]XP_026225006.1 alpha-tectorin-like [Anabas testudineus]
MLHPLIYLSALSLLAGAAAETITTSLMLDTNLCPFTFYGQEYEQIYVNISSEIFTICFNGFYNPETRQDCIVGPQLSAQRSVSFSYFPYNTGDENFVHQHLPNIKSPLECIVLLDVVYLLTGRFLLINMGTQAALFLRTHLLGSWVYDVKVNGDTVDKLNVTNTDSIYQYLTIIDTSGCRHSGVMYKPGTVVNSNTGTCLNCSDTAVLQTSDCMMDTTTTTSTTTSTTTTSTTSTPSTTTTTCTVTGPTVIDFHGQVNSIQDRCAYSLLSDPSVPNFQVLANFQERRRKDVSFLDSVTLTVDGSGVLIHLEQGGVVKLDDTVLTLNSSAQLVHGVELSKNQSGVTANISLPNYTTSVFFDGYTAQITLKGPGEPSLVSGLCGNSSRSLSELRISNYSVSGCEVLYNDTADSTIDCTMETERCNLLKEAPFTACNNLIDPQPYITACTDTLCKYPAVDGLDCQFLEAYARACSLLNNNTVEDWWSTIGCSPPQAFCQDRICSAHEFCGDNTDGGTRCFCRALFADKYSSTGALGDPAVCSKNSASLDLVGCLLEDRNIDYSALNLKNQTCRGQMDELTHMVTFSFNSTNTCGAVVKANNSQIIYENTIMKQSSSSEVISRKNQVYIDFSCFYIQPDIKSASFRIKYSSVIPNIKFGPWDYTLTMKSYTDAAYTEVLLDQKIWVEIKTDGLDGRVIAVVTDFCWATNEPSPNSTLRYDLIKNSCPNPADQTVRVQGNGLGTSNYFSFNMFQFSGHSGDVYLHCKVQLCVKQNNNCVPDCVIPLRSRRSARPPKYEHEAAALITMTWTN